MFTHTASRKRTWGLDGEADYIQDVSRFGANLLPNALISFACCMNSPIATIDYIACVCVMSFGRCSQFCVSHERPEAFPLLRRTLGLTVSCTQCAGSQRCIEHWFVNPWCKQGRARLLLRIFWFGLEKRALGPRGDVSQLPQPIVLTRGSTTLHRLGVLLPIRWKRRTEVYKRPARNYN